MEEDFEDSRSEQVLHRRSIRYIVNLSNCVILAREINKTVLLCSFPAHNPSFIGGRVLYASSMT